MIVPEDLGAVDQGELPVGEAVEAILEEAEIHSWTFAIDNPALANITLTPDPELDALLVLFDPDGQLVSVTDETLNGEVEQIENQELNAAGEYTLIVGGFTFGGSSYSLLLELGE